MAVAGSEHPDREHLRDLTPVTVPGTPGAVREAAACPGPAARVSAMSSRRRDRHGRGLRGPLALPNPWTHRPARPPRPATPGEAFAEAVHVAVERVARQCPEALTGVAFGIEDVPVLPPGWTGPEVPLALAVEATAEELGQVVVYRRPLEHRTSSRRGLQVLVYRTVVEQLAALTGRSTSELDPDGAADEDDDD